AFLFPTALYSNDALGRSVEDLAREPPVVDRSRQDQGANHASEGRERVLLTARGIVAGHERGQEVDGILQLPGEGGSHLSGLTSDARAERRDDAAATGRVAVRRRQVSRHDAPECLARPLTIGRALPDASPARQGEADRLGRERLLGFELTVDGAMSHAGTPADRVDAGRADAVLAEQARGRGQDLLPILHRSLLGDPHPPTPEPKPDEVVVRIDATPINPSDLGLMLAGADMSAAKVSGSPEDPVVTAPIPPAVLRSVAGRIDQSLPVGNEGAGVVVRAGSSDEARALVGKTVAILGGAMYAQFRTIKAGQCLVLPPGTAAAEGASCFVNPLTALGMVETMRAEGHAGLVHTAAASN